MKNWKARRAPMRSGAIELYDLSKDVGEERDVAAANPEVVRQMSAVMDRAHVPSELWRVKSTTLTSTIHTISTIVSDHSFRLTC